MIIALIGMTGAGKTTIGKILIEKLNNYIFLDTDEIITQENNLMPSEIFVNYGEEKFREIESQTLNKILSKYKNNINENLILSCGGGIILKEYNRELLHKYAFTVWLVRDIQEVIKNQEVLSRPPINNIPENYIKIFKDRENLYSQSCNFRVDFINAEEAVEIIIKNLNLN